MAIKESACLFNFIIYTEDGTQLEYLKKLADSVHARYPSKILLVFADSTCEKDSMQIDNNGEDRNAFVKFTVSGKHLNEVELLVLPILRPDYPIYTLWSGNPHSNPTNLNFFKSISSRLIFDSETSDDLLGFTEEMLQELKRPALEVVDINWARILGWRTILTEVIDTKERIECLQEADHLKIEFTTAKRKIFQNDAIQSLYLSAWLSSCLNWQFKSVDFGGDKITLLFKDSLKQIQLELIPREVKALSPGSTLSFELFAKEDQLISIRRKEEAPQVIVHLSSHDTCSLPFTLYLPNIHRGSSYLTQLLFAKTGPHYSKMLHTLSKILAYKL